MVSEIILQEVEERGKSDWKQGNFFWLRIIVSNYVIKNFGSENMSAKKQNLNIATRNRVEEKND